MKLFTWVAGGTLYKNWGSFDTESQRAIIFTILAVVGIVLGILAIFGLIKYLIHFYKLPRKDKKEELFTIPIYLIVLFPLSYFILNFLSPWDVNIGVASVFFLVFVSLFLAAIVFNDSILKKTYPEVEKKESEEVYRENLKEKAEKTFSSWFSKKPNKKSDIESRLEKLTQLLDENLISKEEYEEQRKKIIGDV